MLDEEKRGRGGRRDEEAGGTKRKEGRGGRRDGEEGGTRRVKMKKLLKRNEKVAKGRIIGLAGFYLTLW